MNHDRLGVVRPRHRLGGGARRTTVRSVALAAATVVVASTAAVGLVWRAEPAAAAPALRCDQNTIYGVTNASGQVGQVVAIDVTTGATEPVTNVGPVNNALGVTENGLDAYASQNGGSQIAHYDTVTGATTFIPDPGNNDGVLIRGAVNPATGVYYYGSNGSTAALRALDTDTDSVVGQVGSISGLLATIGTPAVPANGDFAFSTRGLLFVVTGDQVRRVDDTTVPTTAGNQNLTTSLVATLPGVNSPGIAFSADGYLYVASGSSLIKLDPASGENLGTTQIAGGFVPSDLATCNYPNTVSAEANIADRVRGTDQFGLSVTGGGIARGNTATTSGTANGLQPAVAGAALTIPSREYTVTQTAAGTTSLAQYSTTYRCENVNNDALVASGTGNTGTFTFPAATSSDGTDVVCVFTNTPRTGRITLTQDLGSARNDPSDQFTTAIRSGSATGPVQNQTDASTTTGAGSTVTPGTGTTGATTLVNGRPYYLTSRTPPGSASEYGQYTSRITCTDAAGLQPGLPTDAAYTGSLEITPVADADISCVVTSAATAPRLSLSTALADPRVAAGDQFGVAIRTGSADGPVVSDQTGATTTGSGSTVTPGTGTTGTFAGSPQTTYYLTGQPGSNAARYVGRLTCADANGFQDDLPTNVAWDGSYAISPTAGAAIGCTVTYARTPAALSLALTDPDDLTVGRESAYTARVSNDGGQPSPATVDVRLDPGVEYTRATGTGWTCSATGAVADGQLVTCSGPTIAPGDDATVQIVVTPRPGAAGDSVVARGAVDTDGGDDPVDPTTCTGAGTPTSGCATTAGVVVGNGVDLGVSITNPSSLVVGVEADYAVVVTNRGTGPADSATVSFALPDGVDYVGATGATCSALAGRVTCTVGGPIAADGGTAPFTVTVRPTQDAAGDDVVLRGAVDDDGGTAPGDPAACQGSDVPTRGCAATAPLTVGPGVGLTLDVTGPTALTVGVPAQYDLVVTNGGTGRADDATVEVQLPAGVSYQSATGATCTPAGQILRCTLAGPIAAGGDTGAFSVTVEPQPAAAGASVVVRGAVDTDGGTDPVAPSSCTGAAQPTSGCGTSTAVVVADGIDLRLAIEGPPSLTAGVPAQFRLTVTNDGTGPAATATVTFRVPDGVRYVSADGADCTLAGSLLTCTVTGPIAAGGGTAPFTVTVVPRTSAIGDPQRGLGAVDTDGGTTPVDPETCTADGQPSAGCAVTGPETVRRPILLLAKSAEPVAPATSPVERGDEVGYTFTLTNDSTVAIDTLAVDDPTVGAVTCPTTPLAPGASTTCTADVPHTVTQADVDRGSIDNTATASARLVGCADDCVEQAPPSSVRTLTDTRSALGVVKSGELVDSNDDGKANAGEKVRYTVRVSNTGTTSMREVAVVDPLLRLTCPSSTLGPQESEDCTGTYTVKAGDERAGEIVNVASATGRGPDGSAVSSPPTDRARVETPAGAAPSGGTSPGDGDGDDADGGAGDADDEAGSTSPGSGALPTTGGPAMWLGVLGATTAGLGAVLLWARRRPQVHRHRA